MALSTPSASPAVVVKEIDLTGGVPNVQSTTGAIVGNFRWGPAEQRVLIDNETNLANTFASPGMFRIRCKTLYDPQHQYKSRRTNPYTNTQQHIYLGLNLYIF